MIQQACAAFMVQLLVNKLDCTMATHVQHNHFEASTHLLSGAVDNNYKLQLCFSTKLVQQETPAHLKMQSIFHAKMQLP